MYSEEHGNPFDDIFSDVAEMDIGSQSEVWEQDEQLPRRELCTLLSWLMLEGSKRGMTTVELAKELGVTFGYFIQLRDGIRSSAHISREFSETCAEFLGLPRISILIAAGVVRRSDFYADAWDLSYRVDRAIAYMRGDHGSELVVPKSLDDADLETKLLIIQLYERLTGMLLVPDRADVELLLDHSEEE
jgi:hypothetical protein